MNVEYNKLYAFNLLNGDVLHGVIIKSDADSALVWNNKAQQVNVNLRACTRITKLSN